MISTKGRYAIRLMLDLAAQPPMQPIPLDTIAARQDISKKYLESIVKLLVGGKLVKGTSGKGGGYFLTKTPNEYNIWEILLLTEGTMATVSCLEEGAEKCPRESFCPTLSMWKDYDHLVKNYFSNITLESLLPS